MRANLLKLMGCLLGLLALTAAVGCGSSGGGTTSTGATGTGATSTGSSSESIGASKSDTERQVAEDAGKKAGAAAGAPVAVPKKTVGIITVLSSAEAIARTTAATKEGAKLLGWDVKVCDAQGQPAMAASCANSLISQHVSIIFGEAIEPAWVKSQLALAKSKGIPWINTSGPVTPSPLIASQSTYSETLLGSTMGQYIVDSLQGKGDVALTTSNAQYAIRVRTKGMLAPIHAAPGIKVVEVHDINLADAVGDGRQWAGTIVTRYPDLSAIGIGTDADSAGIVPVVNQKYPGKQFPDRPLLVAPFGDLSQLAWVRKGQADAVAETPIEATGWIALDRAAALFAQKTPLPVDATKGYELAFLPVTMVTSKNVPKDPKSYFPSPVDFVSFFEAKWHTQYTGVQ